MSLDLIATIYGETPQGGTVESPVPLTGVSSFKVDSNTITLPIPRELHRIGDVSDKCVTRTNSEYNKRLVFVGDDAEAWTLRSGNTHTFAITAGTPTIRKGLSNKYKNILADDFDKTNGIYLYNTLLVIVSDLSCNSVAEFKNKLKSEPLIVYVQVAGYNGTNGLDVCLTEYQTGFVELDGTEASHLYEDIFSLDYSAAWPTPANRVNSVCSHYPYRTYGKGKIGLTDNGKAVAYRPNGDYTGDEGGLANWKAYLAAQKAAGTPVQVAYQLATPETYAIDPLDIYVTTMFPVVVSTGPITYEVIPQIHPFKTDWKIQPKTPEGYYNGDWFEIEDYNHILDNYQTIYKIAKALYPDLQIPTFVSPTLGAPTKASEINTIERTIDAFKTLTIALSDVGATKTWLDNGNLFNFEDINRWEQVALSYYTVFLGQVELLPKLQFKLGGAQF